jgi:hypothetical protein
MGSKEVTRDSYSFSASVERRLLTWFSKGRIEISLFARGF